MKYAEYLRDLNQPGGADGDTLEAYAQRVGTSVGYLRVHVLHARKAASLAFMRRLAAASQGQVSLLDVLRHYGVPPEELKEQAA